MPTSGCEQSHFSFHLSACPPNFCHDCWYYMNMIVKTELGKYSFRIASTNDFNNLLEDVEIATSWPEIPDMIYYNFIVIHTCMSTVKTSTEEGIKVFTESLE